LACLSSARPSESSRYNGMAWSYVMIFYVWD
jgi:hypothetical protein